MSNKGDNITLCVVLDRKSTAKYDVVTEKNTYKCVTRVFMATGRDPLDASTWIPQEKLTFKFRMDEKQFDVDGAYNIRYEIIKKRIDKAHIKDTDQRLTVPGKISIVYSQDKDAVEYMKYIKYLQSKNYLGKVEKLELENLQGISGLKALRIEVIYQDQFNEKEDSITFEDLIQEIKS